MITSPRLSLTCHLLQRSVRRAITFRSLPGDAPSIRVGFDGGAAAGSVQEGFFGIRQK
jgi:hypothetical protein